LTYWPFGRTDSIVCTLIRGDQELQRMEDVMADQMFDTFRKASESWMKMQQDLFQTAAPSTLFALPQGAGVPPDWARNAQKRCINLATEVLERQRESFDALFKSTINLLQQTSQISESKSPEDYRRATEDLWRKWFESVKTHSETQFRDVQTFAGKSLEIVQSAQA
jgi:hypothetical protein